MKTSRNKRAERQQQTPAELRDRLLDFLERKFYQGHPIPFSKDRPRLLAWVVLWPAKWFDQRGVTVTSDRYAEIFFQVFFDAQIHGTEKVTYLPAWLAKVIQSHFAHHGDEYYEAAKTVRAAVETALMVAGRSQGPSPDPVRALAQAARLLKPSKRVAKPPVNDQLPLL